MLRALLAASDDVRPGCRPCWSDCAPRIFVVANVNAGQRYLPSAG
jgi:hypothetical protein